MTTSELIQAIFTKATGKTTTLSSGDAKYAKILAIANGKIREWQNQENVDWNSLYEPKQSFGAVTATDTFAIPAGVRKLSDTPGDDVLIEYETDNYYHFQIVAADTLKRYPTGNYCAQIGSNLVFNRTFTTEDPEYGGTIYVPVYLSADELVNASDVVPVDSPQWLIVASAAEYVRTDVTRQNQYPNLVAEANPLMEKMIQDNDGQIKEPYIPYRPEGADW